MIFVTVGSATFKFERLFKNIDVLCEKKILNKNEIIAQTGITNYKSDYYSCVDMLPNTKFMSNIKKSDIIICHAGVGTIINALQNKKKVIVFPRLSKFGEHIDDHQLDICENFSKKGYVLCAKNYDELESCIINLDKFVPNEYCSKNNEINDLIINFINKG